MNVRQLMDYLAGQDPDAEVELAIIAAEDPSTPGDIDVDRYPVLGTLPWHDDDAAEGDVVIWLIGGEEGDFDDLLHALDEQFGDDD